MGMGRRDEELYVGAIRDKKRRRGAICWSRVVVGGCVWVWIGGMRLKKLRRNYKLRRNCSTFCLRIWAAKNSTSKEREGEGEGEGQGEVRMDVASDCGHQILERNNKKYKDKIRK
jgi:hypothetical protein